MRPPDFFWADPSLSLPQKEIFSWLTAKVVMVRICYKWKQKVVTVNV